VLGRQMTENNRRRIAVFRYPQQVRDLAPDVHGGEALGQGRAGGSGEGRGGEGAGQPGQQPVPVHRRMPVVAAIERGSQFPGRGHIGIAIQRMANLVWVFFVDTRQREICEPFSSLNVELAWVFGSGSAGR